VGGFWDTVVNELGMWVSPDRGLLVWTPVMLVLLPAVVQSWRELPDWARWLPLGRLAQELVGPALCLQFGAIAVGAMSNGFFVVRDDAWTDNSYWLALRHVPGVWVWTIVMVALGVLATRVWRERGLTFHRTGPTYADSVSGPSTA
jgi:hypothetical protein